jgi:hypothetical protein
MHPPWRATRAPTPIGGFSAGGPLLAADQRTAAAARGWLCCSYVRTPVGMSRRYVSQVARQQKVIFEIAKKYRGLRAGPENGSRGYSECALSEHGAAATYGC